jgi:hypothetical protein
MDSNNTKYIGYSMSKKQWILIPEENVRNDTYEFFDAGATAFTYVNTTSNTLVKIIHGPYIDPEDNYVEFIKKCEKEVEYQQRASKYKLGPKIYYHGYVPKEKSFYSKGEYPYYYIVMDYLSNNTGWTHIHGGEIPNSVFCNYIQTLVSKTGLINVKDPELHFYYNENEQKLYMIDYGNCEECVDISESECVNLMSNKLLGINCIDESIKRKRESSNTSTKRTRRYGGSKKYKRKTNKKRTHKNKTKRKLHYKK